MSRYLRWATLLAGAYRDLSNAPCLLNDTIASLVELISDQDEDEDEEDVDEDEEDEDDVDEDDAEAERDDDEPFGACELLLL